MRAREINNFYRRHLKLWKCVFQTLQFLLHRHFKLKRKNLFSVRCSFDSGFPKIMLVTITNFAFDLCPVIPQHESFKHFLCFRLHSDRNLFMSSIFMIRIYKRLPMFKSHGTNAELVAGGHVVLGTPEFNSAWSRL